MAADRVEGEGEEVKKAGAKKEAVKAARRKSAPRMSQNVTAEALKTAQKERAAVLVAEDRLTDELIADEVGVERRTLARWKLEPQFRESVKRAVDEIREKVIAQGVAARQNRVDALNDRWARMRRVIEQRAKVYKGYAGGGDTGLIVKQTKGIGKGEDFQVIEEYAVDTGLLRELREHEKQAAIEVGEWAERREITGKDGEDLFKHVTVEIIDGNNPDK